MNRFFVLFLLVGLIVFPQQLMLESFKRQSTYILDDDLEEILSPWKIFDVQGWRLFTKLSNLTGSTEELMNDTSDNSFMIGLLLPEILPTFKTAIFWSTLKNTSPANITIDPLNTGSPVSGSGSVFGIWEIFIDNNGDGNYDIHEYCDEHKTDFSDELLTATAYIAAYDLGSGIVGFIYNRYKSFSKAVSSDTIEYKIYDLYPNFAETLNLAIDFNLYNDDLFERPFNSYNLSYIIKDVAEYRIGISLGAAFYKEVYDEKSFHYYFVDQAPNIQNYENNQKYKSQNFYQLVNPVNQFNIGFNALKKDDNGLNEMNLNFFYGTGGDYGRSRYEANTEINLTGIMGFTEKTILNGYNLDTLSLDYKNMGMNLMGRIIRKLGENVEFGIGLNINLYQEKNTYNGTYNEYNYTYYDDGDNEVLDVDDYTTTYTFNATYEIEQRYNRTNFGVPVGVEITITPKKNWFIRFGANPIKTLSSLIEQYTIKDYSNEVVVEINGAGDTTITITPPDLPPEYKKSEYSEDEICNFAYGLGWHPNNNISIDFITMFEPTKTLIDLDWIKSLRVSTTLKFY